MSWLIGSTTPILASSTPKQVSLLGVEAKINSQPNNAVNKSSDEEFKIIKFHPDRFSDYYELLSKFLVEDLKNNHAEESVLSKKNRPFLLPNEVVLSGHDGTSTNNLTVIKSKIKKNGKKGFQQNKGKSLRGGSEDAKIFTASNPPPSLNRFVPSNKPYRITQEAYIANFLTTSNSIQTFGSTSFSIASLDQITQLAAVFDQYMITEIEVWIIPIGLGTVGSVGVGGGMSYVVIDYDDTTALTTTAQAQDYTNVCAAPQSEGIYRRFVPHIAVAAYSGAFTSYTNLGPQWIDTVSQNVQHYGIKMAATISNAATQFQMQYRLHCSFRNVR
jgi:hypothetical protein